MELVSNEGLAAFMPWPDQYSEWPFLQPRDSGCSGEILSKKNRFPRKILRKGSCKEKIERSLGCVWKLITPAFQSQMISKFKNGIRRRASGVEREKNHENRTWLKCDLHVPEKIGALRADWYRSKEKIHVISVKFEPLLCDNSIKRY